MDYIILWFIMTNGSGYLPPMDVRPTDSVIQCNISGAIVGVQVDKLENPTKVLWPDSQLADKHCEVDVAAKVAALENGEYHFCTTIMGKPIMPDNSHMKYVYIQHDPHCSVYFLKSDAPMTVLGRPTNIKITGQ